MAWSLLGIPRRNRLTDRPEVNHEHLQWTGKPVKAWVRGVELEDKARQQLQDTASMPFIFKHLAVMPDVHWGIGSTIGSVIPTKRAIIPAAVGVDIGCGMTAVELNMGAEDLPDNLKALRAAIEAGVPHGRTNNGGPGDQGAWVRAPLTQEVLWDNTMRPRLDRLAEKHPKLLSTKAAHPTRHLGTLGGGNHFIELCLDERGRVWIMLHSGSRGIGNRIGSYFISLAKKDMEKWFINLPSKDLAYLPEGTDHFDDYVEAVGWAQDFAAQNRHFMLDQILSAMSGTFPSYKLDTGSKAIDCHHNYVQKEHHFGENVWITRKGAVAASEGLMGIIPGSMGVQSYIVRGLGNKMSFKSCSHGAGRRMGRRVAKKTFTLEDHAAATKGVECRKDEDVLDETPGAYKDIEAVMEAQKDLVEVVHTLKQVLCVKG